jgi:prepilin-type N-terminal cleavage/methylation domain-containing protein
MTIRKNNSGFSLVEMAISVIIIGILITGIATGLDILVASKTTGVIADLQNYKRAYDEFKLKYNVLPGDMPDAIEILGAAQQGDGDSQIESGSEENVMAWQHLALAGLIDGNYSGNPTIPVEAGVDFPAGPHENTVYDMTYFSIASTIMMLGGHNAIVYAGPNTTDAIPLNRALIPREAYDIDYRIDDGNSINGIIGASGGADTDGSKCLDYGGGLNPTGAYKVSQEGTHCIIAYFLERNL